MRCAGAVLVVLALGAAAAGAAEAPEADWPSIIAQIKQQVDRSPSTANDHLRQQLATAYNNYGISLGEQGLYDLAIQQAQEAIRLQPDNAQLQRNLATLYLNAAHVQQQRFQPREAVQLIAQALRLQPAFPEAYALLGEIEYSQQHLKEAKTAWQRALELDPGRPDVTQRMQRLDQELPVEGGFDRIAQAYFDLRFQEDQLARATGFDLRDLLLRARREVGSDFAYWPKYKLVVLIYSSENFRQLRKDTPEWVGGLYDGKIRVPLPGGQLDAATVQQILYHEYTHALVHDLTQDRCPTWFNEGLAEYEGYRNGTPRLDQVAAALAQNRLVSWGQLNDLFSTGMPVERVTLGYQQSHSIVRYLVERYGFWRIRRLLKSLGGGATMDEALAKEFSLKPARIESNWREWLGGVPGLVR